MRLLYTSPVESSYGDGTTWFYMPVVNRGTWLGPNNHVVVLTDEELKALTDRTQAQKDANG